jgi:hypothetical protein
MAKTAKRLEVRARYIHHPEFRFCPHCGGPLRAQPYYRWRKTIQCLHGAVHVASQARECGNPRCEHRGQPYTSAAAQMVAVPECTYGLDVIVQIGWWRDRERVSRAQIRSRLRQRGVKISERQLGYLYARYQALLGCAERLEAERLQDVVRERGAERFARASSGSGAAHPGCRERQTRICDTGAQRGVARCTALLLPIPLWSHQPVWSCGFVRSAETLTCGSGSLRGVRLARLSTCDFCPLCVETP